MLMYDYYYRHFGVRRSMQLVQPTLHGIETLDLPRDSVLHYVGTDDVVYGIPGDDFILRHTTRSILVDYIVHMDSNVGNPRSTYLPVARMIRDYQRKYRRFRQVKDLAFVWRDGRNLLIMNYAPLNHLYRYVKSVFSGYYKWVNVQKTMWVNLRKLIGESDRQHFIECYLPTVLPAPSLLMRGENSITRTILQSFTEHESLFILEIWKWLGKHRDQSMLADYTQEELNKVNLIWRESGRWMVINLGLLNSWRKPITSSSDTASDDEDDEKQESSSAAGGMIAPANLQRRFLRLLMFLFEQRTVMAPGKLQAPEDVIANADKSEVPVAGTAIAKPVIPRLPDPVKPITPAIHPLLQMELPDIDDEDFDRIIDTAVNGDLEELEHISVPLELDENAEGEPSAPIAHLPKHLSLEDSVMVKADALADAGMLSGAEYRRLATAAVAYKKLPDPYGGGGTLEEQAKISTESLQVSQVAQIPDIDTVFDKSMLKSSLFHFDRQYISQVMAKDVTNAVLSVQNAGVAVTGYHVDVIEDAINHYEKHVVRLTPVSGNSSTIHFRLPVVHDDGTFVANGVKYRMRKQRGDVPIRKLSPTKVALTSYYSKLFVERSQRSVNNYPNWLINNVMAMGIDRDNETITDLKVSDVFDSALHLPRLYSTLAGRFKSLTANGDKFYFDYAGRKAYFGEELVDKAEHNGMTMIGVRTVRTKGASQVPILVDDSNTLYELVGETLSVVGTFEKLIGLDVAKTPIEQLDIKVFGKNIPVGIFLAYHLGLEGLFALLKVTPRRVAQGERVNLNEDEFALVFADETLVFQKENKLAMMCLIGFRVFANACRNYSVHNFDKKDIYFNLLDSIGLGVRYLREMDLIVDMFIDPITKEILVDMGEPTDFIGLLVKAGQLLQTDWSPDETDMAYMRIKGYERFSGAVYAELVKAIRTHTARRGNSGNSVDMPPYVVWNAIQQDPSMGMVEESNPIHNLKEKEEVTYGGVGGRSRRSMVKRTRVFHENDMGVISEATKDSSDVAVTTFLTADPGFTSVRGLTKRWQGEREPTTLLSTSALLAPAADRDDPKRVSYIAPLISNG